MSVVEAFVVVVRVAALDLGNGVAFDWGNGTVLEVVIGASVLRPRGLDPMAWKVSIPRGSWRTGLSPVRFCRVMNGDMASVELCCDGVRPGDMFFILNCV